MHERITVDPKIAYGQGCIKGTKHPGHQIGHMLVNVEKMEEFLKE